MKQNVFRIKKILRKKKIDEVKHNIKWLGYDKKFNDWIPKTDIEKVQKSHVYKMRGLYNHTIEEEKLAVVRRRASP